MRNGNRGLNIFFTITRPYANEGNENMLYDPTLKIYTDPDVYPPSEDSILLIRSFDVEQGEKVLEIGSGSGIVSIHCMLNGAEVTCGDINPKAVALTRRNIDANGLKADVLETDVYSNIDGKYDTIIFNLPYLPVQEEGDLALAWSGGDDGLGPLPRLLSEAPEHLNENGRIIVVISSLMDQDALNTILKDLKVRTLSELPLFFEVLKVLEISL